MVDEDKLLFDDRRVESQTLPTPAPRSPLSCNKIKTEQEKGGVFSTLNSSVAIHLSISQARKQATPKMKISKFLFNVHNFSIAPKKKREKEPATIY